MGKKRINTAFVCYLSMILTAIALIGGRGILYCYEKMLPPVGMGEDWGSWFAFLTSIIVLVLILFISTIICGFVAIDKKQMRARWLVLYVICTTILMAIFGLI
ncbi:hypothetical protein JD969_12495 [Planctomycetota bacterium]|nr:hypothetical protein JD969_12495 [Planctomycetota bacterium]